MVTEKLPCPKGDGYARLVQMTATSNVYRCPPPCGHEFTTPVDKAKTCVICDDTKKVGTGDPCPHCEDMEMINSLTRY